MLILWARTRQHQTMKKSSSNNNNTMLANTVKRTEWLWYCERRLKLSVCILGCVCLCVRSCVRIFISCVQTCFLPHSLTLFRLTSLSFHLAENPLLNSRAYMNLQYDIFVRVWQQSIWSIYLCSLFWNGMVWCSRAYGTKAKCNNFI